MLFLLSGCASPTYRYGLTHRNEAKPNLDTVNFITFGGEHPNLDRVEHVVHYPLEKIKAWFPKRHSATVDPSDLRRAAIYQAQQYFVLNELPDVRIDVREYDPGEQWKRLKANERIHPVWKYTLGTASHLKYAWLPGRVFHYDKYNPYTNTLTINSTTPSMALYEAAEAKDVRNQRLPGTYMAACCLPIFPLVRDARVANDVLSYARIRQEWAVEKELYPQIYSAMGSDLVSQVAWFFPSAYSLPSYYMPAFSFAGGVAGKATGKVVLKERELEQALISRLERFGAAETR